MTVRTIAADGIPLHLSPYFFRVKRVEGWHGAPSRQIVTVPIVGRDGALPVRSVAGAGRLLQVSGTIVAGSRAARDAAIDALEAALVSAGLINVTRVDQTTRELEGWLEGGLTVTESFPQMASRTAVVSFSIRGRDAYKRDVEPLYRAIEVATQRYTLPCGDAPSSPILRIMPGTTPQIIYRDAGGTQRKQMTFATVAANSYLDVLMNYPGKIVKYASGVASNGAGELTSGDLPWAIDPGDGDVQTAQYPTLEITAGKAAIYWWRQWL